MESTMRAYDIIAQKRDGKNLSQDEIQFCVDGYVKEEIPDYQMSALLMAIYLRGMSAEEVSHLTDAMMNSGQVLDLSGVGGTTVDKHSTGGVGDKVSLVLAPLVAAAGVPVPMLSGRGLGHTGGTLDKLESLPGFRTSLSPEEFVENVRSVGLAIMGQSERMAPADGKLYALRDVTATVSSLPLIASSIMSKKLAAGPNALVFDVKVGRGAVMPETDRARELARLLVRIARAHGRRAVALLTRMDQPLGRTVGNAMEVAEAVECLRGRGPEDLMEVTMALGIEMLILGGAAGDVPAARSMLETALRTGSGLEKFKDMVRRQGGDERAVADPRRLPQARLTVEVKSSAAGYIAAIDARQVGQVCVRLGAGRSALADRVDPAVGVRLLKKAGDAVSPGEVVALVMVNDAVGGQSAAREIGAAVTYSESPPSTADLVFERIADGGGGAREV
jgi:pyrimidine-nucleoside phosphorylase